MISDFDLVRNNSLMMEGVIGFKISLLVSMIIAFILIICYTGVDEKLLVEIN